MSVKIRILNSANRTMQRAGFLKLLCAQAARKDTNSLESLGRNLVSALARRLRIAPPFNENLREYARTRLTDRVYQDLRRLLLDEPAMSSAAFLELQDLYLSDSSLPSNTGKLVETDWKRYPYLATALDLIKPGTYSVLTRALVLLAVTPKEELAAFETYDADHNPLKWTREQSAVLLYCFIDNDAEIICRLFDTLLSLNDDIFDERLAGDAVPQIIRSALKSFGNAALPIEDRERVETLEKVAKSVEEWRGRPNIGSGAREIFIRVRLEPYCDLGLLAKPEKHRFCYQATDALRVLRTEWREPDTTDEFLETKYFATLAKMFRIKTRRASQADARTALLEASTSLKSALGYSPITDVGLLAGLRLLFQKSRTMELRDARQLLRDWQKRAPTQVRFTVDRMGALAYVKFADLPPSRPAKSAP